MYLQHIGVVTFVSSLMSTLVVAAYADDAASPCPVGLDGDRCETDHVPSCRIATGGALVPPWHPTTCACLLEWSA